MKDTNSVIGIYAYHYFVLDSELGVKKFSNNKLLFIIVIVAYFL